MKRKQILLAILLLLQFFVYSQNRNSIWCFGDSALIDFSGSSPVTSTCAMRSRGTASNISDSLGNLLFYAFTRSTLPGRTGLIYNSNDSIMDNGSDIIGEGWYNEMVIVPHPSIFNFYYLFSIGVTDPIDRGLYYSIIDMNQNGGLGKVIQKNVMINNYEATDCLTAIKHGNGRDWWIFMRRYDGTNNLFFRCLISKNLVIDSGYVAMGYITNSGFYNICFSKDGSKMATCDLKGLIELYNFDRCSGTLNNYVLINNETYSPLDRFCSIALSQNGNKLYAATNDTTSYLYQFDLAAANIPASRQLLYTMSFPQYGGGFLKLAPDDKIYWSSQYYNGSIYPYPYPDSMYNQYNTNLSVIYQPDSVAPYCDFRPYDFSLGGHRTYYGLPNNPNYDMNALGASICDSLGLPNTVTNNQSEKEKSQLNIFYHSGWQTTFINANGLSGKNYSLNIFDITGKRLFFEQGKLTSQYFTKDLHFNFSNGIYIVSLASEKEKLTTRFIVQ